MLQAVLDLAPPDRLAGHFHDTVGRALDNIEVALDYGLQVFDAACGGLGGCPFAPGAAGNVPTERVVPRLEAKGIVTGLDAGRLVEAAKFALRLRSTT
jgi:hydroxymethylglutaryl-CoA lyase